METEVSFYTTTKRKGRLFLMDPVGRPFFSIGMNHIESATLRYPENLHLWREKYGNSQRRWLQEAVAPDLRSWGFNTVGWCQEVIIRGDAIHRHSRNFTFEEYQWLGLPYCHMLPFTEAHQWDVETRYPDVFSADFIEWCDCVAREHCARLADDPNLVGYFYCDCPQWVHAIKPELKGPWFDPVRLDSDAGRRALSRMAEQYYRVTHDAIRRYDPNHLILGDRYEATAPLPNEILRAALPYVDVLSFQFFSDAGTIAPAFSDWHELTGKPILLADACVPGRDPGPSEEECTYPLMLRTLREIPSCVGWHYCGAYLRNRARREGFRDENEQITDPGFVKGVQEANSETADWAAGFAGGSQRREPVDSGDA
jgi:hypothetical protein